MLLQTAANVNLVNSFLLTLPNSLYTQDLPLAPGHTAGTLWSQSKRCCLPGLPKTKTAMRCIEYFYFSDKEIAKGQNKRKITDLCNKGSTKIMEQSHVSSASSTCVRIKSGTDAAVSRQVDVALRTSLSFSTFIISAWPMSAVGTVAVAKYGCLLLFRPGGANKTSTVNKKVKTSFFISTQPRYRNVCASEKPPCNHCRFAAASISLIGKSCSKTIKAPPCGHK